MKENNIDKNHETVNGKEFFRIDRLEEMSRQIEQRHRQINGIALAVGGKIIYEKYFNGYGPDDRLHVASVTKSVISALVGIAIEKGHIGGIEEKVLDYFPEYDCPPTDFIKSSMTIRHLLTMTAPSALRSSMSGNEALDRLRRQKNWVPFILDQLGRGGTPGKFCYSTSNTHLLSAIISRMSGMSTREFANRYLFQEIGMKEIKDHKISSFSVDEVFGKDLKGWANDPQGITTGGWGLTLSPRDMIRFADLYMKGGVWKGRQIIPAAWVKESIGSTEGDYGYLWWLFNDRKSRMYAALGSGGNGVWCIPEKELSVAVTCRITRKSDDPWKIMEPCLKDLFGI